MHRADPAAVFTDILDTLITSNGRIYLKQHHVARTFETLRFLGQTTTLARLEQIYDRIEKEYPQHCLRLIFNPENPEAVRVETKDLEPVPDTVRLSLLQLTADMPLSEVQPRLQYKWALRRDWDQLLKTKPPWADDILLLNPDGTLRESSRFNLFLQHRSSETFYTPPLSSGCLNGVYRRDRVQIGHIELPGTSSDAGNTPPRRYPLFENEIHQRDLSQYEVWVANSVRGILRANLI